MTCRVVYDYNSKQPNELSIWKDAIITNVVKQDSEWWMGECNGPAPHATVVRCSRQAGKNGWFPMNYVEEINTDELMKEDKTDAENPLGDLEKDYYLLRTIVVEPQASTPAQRFIFKISDSCTPTAVFMPLTQCSEHQVHPVRGGEQAGI